LGEENMQPLDNFDSWKEKMKKPDINEVLSISDQDEWDSLTIDQRSERLKNLLENPVDDFSVIYRWYFRMKWIQALHTIGVNTPVTLLEIGAGDTDMIPQILAKKYKHPDTCYITANMNKKLTASFKEKTKNLPIRINVIEDAAQNINEYVSGEKFDMIAFEHSVNDILQAMLAERKGIDTTNEDWWQVLPQMIDIIKQEYLNNTLETSVKNEFLALVHSCLEVLKPGGYIIINHFMYQYDLNLGYNPDLWNNMLPIVRKWINSMEGGTEIFFDSFDIQWWLFYKKI
jgi:hypothetical protein